MAASTAVAIAVVVSLGKRAAMMTAPATTRRVRTACMGNLLCGWWATTPPFWLAA